jgi:hypothetical protein
MLHQDNAMRPYPKRVWVLVQAEVVLENGCEVINHEREQMIGATFDSLVAEKMSAVLKENQSNTTLLRSDINPLPAPILDAIQDVKHTEESPDSGIDKLLQMVEI